MTRAKQTARKRKPPARKAKPRRAPLAWLRRLLWRTVFAITAVVLLAVLLIRFVPPPTTYYMWSEGQRLGAPVDQVWVSADQIAPVVFRSVVAAEDANFCTHWGFDVDALRDAIADGGTRGASTLTQQVVKNVYLWHGRTYTRKALEALLTPVVEALWPKRRILEVYLNVAEFDEGIFGIEAAAQHYFGTTPGDLSALQAARLAAILPSPKTRSASRPSAFVQRRARSIQDGAATINRDGRADCFQ